ncbi:MAG: plasmid recombination protein, partial [Eubacteriales bacterium]
MAYAIMRFDRVKKSGLAHTYRHNSRKDIPRNADPSRTGMNRELVGSGGSTYMDLFEEVQSRMLIESPDFGKRKIRSDAAYGIEVLMTFSSHAQDIDLELWLQKNVEWLCEAFNPPGKEARVHDYDGTKKTIPIDNVCSVILHQDEGIPHLHAFIVPVDDKGVLNASYYLGGPERCSRLQSSYAEKMRPLGLERGEERSPASHKDIGRYHNRINEAVAKELPEPQPGESIEAFRERGNTCLQDAELTYLGERTRLEQEIVRAQAETRRIEAENQAVHRQMDRIA